MTDLPLLKIEDVLNKLPQELIAVDGSILIRRAYEVAEEAHRGHLRKLKQVPYIQHPLHVAYSLSELHFEPEVIAAALLHDVLEDCEEKVDRSQLRELFGEEVLLLVEGVTKLDKVEDRVKRDSEQLTRDRDLQDLESLRKMFIAMAKDDIRVIFIKLADRLHNMRTLEGLAEDRQDRMARETLEIFAPLANRLGIRVWKAEFEDLAFRRLYPDRYSEIASLLNARREEREARVQHHIEKLQVALRQAGIPAQVFGRYKHIYSIYRKMHRKNVPFVRIYDTEGIRIIVAKEPQCYQALGVVHGLWNYYPGEFDDYIGRPKPNGYQSLHTAVVADDGAPLEIQIRTEAMDRVAEIGVATHWRYKEKHARVERGVEQYISNIRKSVRELAEDMGDARAFIDTMCSDVFEERVYTFTPQGKLIDLPKGATPIDFAYRVHTDLGHQCRGARVNDKWVALSYQLETGDTVEIVGGRTGGPSHDWLNENLGFTKTHRARQKIRQWFRRQSRAENIARGRQIVAREVDRLGLTWTIEEVADFFVKRYPRREDFLAAVGNGDLSTEAIVSRMEDVLRQQAADQALEDIPEDGALQKPPPGPTDGVMIIQGTGDLLTRVAGCCNPLPGQEIIGYVTRGRGVTIHRRDCNTALRLLEQEPDRMIELVWGQQQATFLVQVTVLAYDRSRLMHDISGVLAAENVNMEAISSGKRDRYNIRPIYMTLEISNLSKLDRVLIKIRQISNVIEAKRTG